MKEQNEKFMCIEPEDMRLQGDFSTVSASLISIKVEKCQGHDYCKPDEELTEFFETDKFLVLLNNQVRFDTVLLSEESMIQESVLKWMKLDLEGLFTHQYQLKTGRSNLQDLLIDMDDFTEYQDELFSVKKFDFQMRAQDRNIVMDLLFEVSLDRHVILRENYNVLDFMGDIGGVQGILISLVQFFLFFINYNHFD